MYMCACTYIYAYMCICMYIYIYIYIKFIREATESAQPDWELDVQQRSYFVLITIVSMYGISNTSHQIRYKVCVSDTLYLI